MNKNILKINSAKYGSGNTFIDVTEIIQTLVNNLLQEL